MSHVAAVRVGDISEQIRGVSYDGSVATTSPLPGHVAVLRANNIKEGGLALDDLVYVPGSVIVPKQLIRAGDVLIATSSGSLTSVGKSAAARADLQVGFGAFCKVMRPSRDVDHSYFAHFFRTPAYRRKVSSLAAGANINNLRAEHLDELQIPLPSMPDQRRIAAILDQTEALQSARRKALAILDELPRSIFVEMFGDPVLNERGWPLVPLSELGSLDRGVSKHRPRNAPELLGGPYPLVQTGEIASSGGYLTTYSATYSEMGLRQSKLWPAGTLCITIAANIAKTGILDFPACFPDSVVGFTAHDNSGAEFVQVWLSFLQEALEKSAPESAQKNINLEILRGLSVPVPPLALRRVFSSRMQELRRRKATFVAASAETDALFASLQHRAFSGQL